MLVSEVGAQSNLRLASAEDLRIEGANVSAGSHLGLEAKDNVVITGAQATEQREDRNQQRNLTAGAGQTKEADGDKPGSRQYKAGVGYDVVTRTHQEQKIEHVGSQLKGASVSVKSDADVQVIGSTVNALAGDLGIDARKVTLGANHTTHETTTTTTQSGGGLTVTGGIDRLGGGQAGCRLDQAANP
ncbi:hemagluttinin repeat family protein [Pseudomonas putida S610]|nr:hemagluttinin repeat family protein [Pseudomonas putida S610]